MRPFGFAECRICQMGVDQDSGSFEYYVIPFQVILVILLLKIFSSLGKFSSWTFLFYLFFLTEFV
jgi:hypothetical protein